MEPRTLQFIMEACHGEWLRGSLDEIVRRICTDSRQVAAHELFLALRGERFDGHAFIPQVVEKGVTGLLVERSWVTERLPPTTVIAVPNTRSAYGELAARYRQDFRVPLVAVAGSNGKTSTKELIASVLRERYHTLSSPGSFNNDIGVPATLLEMGSRHEAAVLEFGTNHKGELLPLLQMARPRYGVLTSIGREHLEFFHDLAGVLQEEGTLAEVLPAEGKLFLNGETIGVEEIRKRSVAPVVSVGFGAEHPWRVERIAMTEAGLSFEVTAKRPEFSGEYSIRLLGRHQALNAALAIAVGAELGLTPDEVRRGLLKCMPAKSRLQLWKTEEIYILDDSYNANADSARAALDALREFPCAGHRIAVVGEMAELGAEAEEAHSEVGRYAAAAEVDHLIAVGRLAGILGSSALEAGVREVTQVRDVGAAADALEAVVQAKDVVLLKASRVQAFEQIRERLQAKGSVRQRDDVSQWIRPADQR